MNTTTAIPFSTPGAEVAAPTQTRPSRLLSLDLLRGLTMAFMILVNDNADEHAYWPLEHAQWNGFTPTDLVFPTFLFLVGISTVLSLSSRLDQGLGKMHLFLHVVRRAVIIFLLGLVVNSFPEFDLHTTRFYGVLPRIAICYFVVGTLYLISPGWRSKVSIAVSLLIGYWLLMRFVPIPGFGVPTHAIPILDPDRNLAAWLDRRIFTAPHLYEHTRDPEGLLSTLPAFATALFGMCAGIWLRTTRTLKQKAAGIAIAGVSGILLGELWNVSFPINKKLWTSSYVLLAAGISLSLLAIAMVVIDIPSANESKAERAKRSRYFTPLLVFGTNAITAYLVSELLASGIPHIHLSHNQNPLGLLYYYIHGVFHDPAFSSLVYSLTYVAICWVPIYILYRRKIFIRI